DERDQPLHLMGSADLMPRNLDRRVEVLVPIEHPKHREWLDRVLEFDLRDDIIRWELQPDDTWVRRGRTDVFEPDAQELMYRWTSERQLQVRR
ncbi:MAG: RNA degradosome polyphosphate kinase, partial [Ilumatobacter fluminis]